MTFFYDLNKKLADIGAKQPLNEDTQINEKHMGASKKRESVRDPKAVGTMAEEYDITDQIRALRRGTQMQKHKAKNKYLSEPLVITPKNPPTTPAPTSTGSKSPPTTPAPTSTPDKNTGSVKEQGDHPGLFQQTADRLKSMVKGPNSQTTQTDTGAQNPPSSARTTPKVREARHPQALDYQQGPEDDEEYRRHHGLDDPDRKRERRLRATDHKTLDRLERQAVNRAKQMDEQDIDEVSRGEYIQQQDTKAERTGKDKFKAFGQTFDTDEVDEGRNDPSPLDDPLTRFRKKHAPGVMKDPKGREEVSKLDTEYGERRKTAYGRGEDEEDEDDDDGKKKAKPTGEKRGRGRPKGSKRAIGAKGPTGRSKLMTREQGVAEDYDRDEYDEEGEMAQSQSRTIEDAAEELQAILDADENLPEWVQKKITLAMDYIDTARDYLAANRPEQEMEESALQAHIGKKKYGDRGMKALQKAGREGASKEKMARIRAQHDKLDEVDLEEKAVSKAQRRAAGIAHAARKGDIPKSELRGASKEMAKMPGGELKKFAKTKEKNLPAKKTEEVEETTTAGNVATGGDAPAKGSKKGGMQFGKGIYDSMNRELEAMIAESMNVSVNMNSEGPNGATKSVTVTATDEDADMLAALLTRSGLGSGMRDDHACPTCGKSPCGCAEQVDENEPDYPTEPVMSDDALQYAGGLNKPKSTGQTTTPIIANQDEREVAYDDDGDELRRIREMAGIQEERKGKPDFLDMDKDGDKDEPMKKAVKDKEEKVDESVERGLWSLWQRIQ